MEFKEFCKKYMRMCKSYENCEGCPRNGKGCLDFDMDVDAIGELENDVEYCGKSFDDNHKEFKVCFNCWNMPVEDE